MLTEDEGDIEYMFTQMISACGLSVIVQSPTAHTASGTKPVPEVQFDPLSVAVSIREAIIFNRGADGTGVRLMRATYEIISTLHTFKPASINKPLAFTEMLKDRDTHPETGPAGGLTNLPVRSQTLLPNRPMNRRQQTINNKHRKKNMNLQKLIIGNHLWFGQNKRGQLHYIKSAR